MLGRFFKTRLQRFIAAALGATIAMVVAISTGGVVLTATILTFATYFGTLITLSRVPDKVSEDWSLVKRKTLGPVIGAKNYLFNHPLVLTVALGAMTGVMVGITTVTGIVSVAISALLGDLLVQAYKDGLDIIRGVKETVSGTKVGDRAGVLPAVA